VTITGTTTENQVLTADTSALADVDGLGTLHYQWQRNTGAASSMSAPTRRPTPWATATSAARSGWWSATPTAGHGRTVTSAATAAIAGVNDPHTGGASITGTATENQVLTAVSTLADADGLGTLHYQWQHDVGSATSMSAPTRRPTPWATATSAAWSG
jgi:hypothetical protein